MEKGPFFFLNVHFLQKPLVGTKILQNALFSTTRLTYEKKSVFCSDHGGEKNSCSQIIHMQLPNNTQKKLVFCHEILLSVLILFSANKHGQKKFFSPSICMVENFHYQPQTLHFFHLALSLVLTLSTHKYDHKNLISTNLYGEMLIISHKLSSFFHKSHWPIKTKPYFLTMSHSGKTVQPISFTFFFPQTQLANNGGGTFFHQKLWWKIFFDSSLPTIYS